MVEIWPNSCKRNNFGKGKEKRKQKEKKTKEENKRGEQLDISNATYATSGKSQGQHSCTDSK